MSSEGQKGQEYWRAEDEKSVDDDVAVLQKADTCCLSAWW